MSEWVPDGAPSDQPEAVGVARDGGGQPCQLRLPRAPRQSQRSLRRFLHGRWQVQGETAFYFIECVGIMADS